MDRGTAPEEMRSSQSVRNTRMRMNFRRADRANECAGDRGLNGQAPLRTFGRGSRPEADAIAGGLTLRNNHAPGGIITERNGQGRSPLGMKQGLGSISIESVETRIGGQRSSGGPFRVGDGVKHGLPFRLFVRLKICLSSSMRTHRDVWPAVAGNVPDVAIFPRRIDRGIGLAVLEDAARSTRFAG